MKKKIVYLVLFFLAIVLQTSVLPIFCKAGSLGDIVLMLVLVGAISEGFFGFFGWAIFAGILYDLAIYERIGLHSLIFLLVIYFVSFFSRRFSVELRGVGVLLFATFVVVASIVSQFVISFSIALDLQDYSRVFEFIGDPKTIAIKIAYNFLLFILCFYALKKIKAFLYID